MLNKIRFKITEISHVTLYGMACLAVVLSFLLFRLNTIPGGFAPVEATTVQSHQSLSSLLNNPINAPYGFLQLLGNKLQPGNIWLQRGVSVGVGIFTVAGLYYILRSWHTTRVAILGSLLLVSSSAFLHHARLASGSVMQFTLICLLAFGVWCMRTKKASLVLWFGTLLLAVCLYIPGFIWLWPGILIWQRQRLLNHFVSATLAARLAAALIFLIAVLGLAQGFVLHPEHVRPWLGLPAQFPSITQFGRNILDVPVELAYRGQLDPVTNVGQLPLLDIFTIAMFLLGTYVYFVRSRLDRSRLLLAVFILSILLVALGGAIELAVLVPLIFLVAGTGIALLLQQWFTVFPRNPFARNIWATLVTAAVLMSVFYNTSRYFVAWANAPETKRAFSAERL